MKNSRVLIISLFLISTFSIGCKDDDCDDETNPECSNFNPCHDSKPANAEFGIYEIIDLREFGRYENETDTVVNSNIIALFKPKHKNDKVTWYIGGEILEQQQVARRNFPPNENISITMIAEKNPNDCLKSSELRDTVTKEFYAIDIGSPMTIIEDAKQMPFWGTWEGYLTDAPNEKFIVTIGHIFEYPNERPQISFAIAGLPKGLPLKPDSNVIDFIPRLGSVFFGYHLLYGKGKDFSFEAVAKINNNNVIIEHSYNETPYLQYILGESQQETYPVKIVKKTFIGKKISNEVRTQ